MFVRKKEFMNLVERVERLEQSENEVLTCEYGRKKMKWYIRMLCSNIKKDPNKELESWEN
jgi:hypothetical protein